MFPGVLSYRFCWHERYCIQFFKENETNFFIFFKEISFYKSEFIQIISIIKSETPNLPPHLPKSYISQVSCKIQLNLHPLPWLLASFLKSFWQPFWVYYGQLRLRIDSCYFYLGKLIHFKIKMPLPIGNLSWYFSKWQLANSKMLVCKDIYSVKSLTKIHHYRYNEKVIKIWKPLIIFLMNIYSDRFRQP